MSGEKPVTEDTASWPKGPVGETTGEGKTDKPAELPPAAEKVSVLEGLSTLKPRAGSDQPQSDKPQAAKPPAEMRSSGETSAAQASTDKGATPPLTGAAKSTAEKGAGPASEGPDAATLSVGPTTEATAIDKPFGTAADKGASKAAEAGKTSDAPPSAAAKPAVSSQPASTVTPPQPIAPSRRGGFVAPLLGGVIAAGLGFGLAHYVPEGWPIGPRADRLAALERQLSAQAAEIAALTAQGAPKPDEALANRLSALEAKSTEPTDLTALSAEIEALKSRLSSLPEGSAADLTPLRNEFTQQLDALRAELAAMPRSNPADLEALRAAAQSEREAIEARAEATRAEAEATARAAMIRGAALRLQAALETGSSFDAALADLTSVGVALPEALSAHAAGVPSLLSLQTQFPEAARAALAASTRPAPEAGVGERLAAFLSAQTGLRSLTPREGTDPDAVLSRAEAAVKAGDLTRALTELDALPAEGAAPLADWRAGATARLAAAAAAQSLIADLDKP